MRRGSAVSAEAALAGAAGTGAAVAAVPRRRHGGRSVSPPTPTVFTLVARVGDAGGVYTTADRGAWYERVWREAAAVCE